MNYGRSVVVVSVDGDGDCDCDGAWVLGKNEGRMEATSNKAWGTGRGTPTLEGCSARARIAKVVLAHPP